MELGLKGKRVLVSGGSRGIGLAITQKFLEEGASVAFFARGEQGVVAAEPVRIDESAARRWYPVIDFSRCTNCTPQCVDSIPTMHNRSHACFHFCHCTQLSVGSEDKIDGCDSPF